MWFYPEDVVLVKMPKDRSPSHCYSRLSIRLFQTLLMAIIMLQKVNGFFIDGNLWYSDPDSLNRVTVLGSASENPQHITIPRSVTYRAAESTIICAVTDIGESAFENEITLKSVLLPSSLRHIGAWAFRGCSSLTKINIPNGVVVIGDTDAYYTKGAVFAGCTSLTNISIPPSVELITQSAFSGCPLECDTVTIPGLCMVDGWIIDTPVDFAPKDGRLELPEGVKIADGTFCGCQGIKSVKLPKTLKRIPNFLFRECDNLTTVEFPEGIEEIGASSFSRCNLQSISLPRSVCLLDNYIFQELPIEELVIPERVEFLPERFCQDCHSLKKVIFKGDVFQIGPHAFENCPLLSAIVFMGNAPDKSQDFFLDLAFGFNEELNPVERTVYVKRGSEGWDTEIPGRWHGMRIEYLEEAGVLTVNASGGKKVPIPQLWIDGYPLIVTAAGGDVNAAISANAANGRKVWECYVLGLDPEIATDDFKITSFTLCPDGTLNQDSVKYTPAHDKWNIPGAAAVLQGAETLDGEWQTVTEANKASLRFFKLVFQLP